MQVEEIIIADSRPLIGLARVGQLELLHSLANRVVMPMAVWKEVSENAFAPGARDLMNADWIEILSLRSQSTPAVLLELGPGEAEAILLAQEHLRSVLLIDDLRARKVAAGLQLRIIGTVGILLRAKKSGLLLEIRPTIKALLDEGIFLDERLITAALSEAGETDS